MLTRTGEYALRALIHLTRNEKDWPIAGRRIAEDEKIPAKYLSTLLSDLVRANILTAARGTKGGFRMVRPARETFLFDVLEPFEPILTKDRPCPFGNRECSDADPCLGHDAWKQVLEGFLEFLKKTSVYDVAIGQKAQRLGGEPEARSE